MISDPNAPDCDFYYFKPAGKWKYHGEGKFPKPPITRSMTHDDIFETNGCMPGIEGDGYYLTVVVIPKEHCTHEFAYPRLIHAPKRMR